MKLIRRPWSPRQDVNESTSLGPDDCLLAEAMSDEILRNSWHTVLLVRQNRELRLFPYPPSGNRAEPALICGLPARPKTEREPGTEEEKIAAEALARMHNVLARIDELRTALDDPENLWQRLQEAWDRAENESDPRMAEIVRHSVEVRPYLAELEERIRRVLRRSRELTPLDRVQEMDRSSMLWMVRQPGRTIAERAGSDQRVLAIVRHENFDTLENRVLHAYLHLAVHFSRQWLREHQRAKNSKRFRDVESYSRLCRRFASELKELGVGVAEPGVTANYVLIEDRAYRSIKDAWDRLLRRDKAEDDLWAWQAQCWTDFCILAVVLAMNGLEEAVLLAQSPLVCLDEAIQGRRFLHDRPLAVFWLKESGLIVEVQARPESVSEIQFAARAHVWLRVTDLKSNIAEHRLPVWTPHCFSRLTPRTEAREAAETVDALRRKATHEAIREGLILMPAHGIFESVEEVFGGSRVRAIAMDAVGATLRDGKRALAEFVRSCFPEETG